MAEHSGQRVGESDFAVAAGSHFMDIGTKIIDEIVKQGMFAVNYPDPEAAHVFVWSSGASEQLHALVCESGEVQIPRREAALYGQALQLLGAPDNGNPAKLLEWAEKTGKRLCANPKLTSPQDSV